METEAEMRAQVFTAMQASAMVCPCKCGESEFLIFSIDKDGCRVKCGKCQHEGPIASDMMQAELGYREELQ